MLRTFVRHLNSGSGRRATKLVISKDESCIVAYHPDTEHEYEFTKPFPAKEVHETMLKGDARDMFTKSPNLEQLQTLTYTPARYWHQYPGKEKRRRYKEWFDDKDDGRGGSL